MGHTYRGITEAHVMQPTMTTGQLLETPTYIQVLPEAEPKTTPVEHITTAVVRLLVPDRVEVNTTSIVKVIKHTFLSVDVKKGSSEFSKY
jgi:hypothetical protein